MNIKSNFGKNTNCTIVYIKNFVFINLITEIFVINFHIKDNSKNPLIQSYLMEK